MTKSVLFEHRRILDQTQAQMAQLLGCSLIGYKRFETQKRPLPAYIAQSMKAFMFCHAHGLWETLAETLQEPYPETVESQDSAEPNPEA